VQGLKSSSTKIDPRQILKPATQNMEKEVLRLIKVFGSNNKA
jgi:fructose/tagatose bisphosphate aldolase